MTALSRPAERTGSGLAALVRIIDGTVLLLAQAIGALVTVALFVAVMTSVIVRYATNASIGWVNELPDLLFPWLAMSGIVVAAQFGRHIVVEFGILLMPRAMGRVVLVIVQLLVAAIFVFLALEGRMVIEVTSAERFPVLGLPMSFAYLALVTGCVLIAVTALTTALRIAGDAGDPLKAREGMEPGGHHGEAVS
ncbi:TRAP transporter small permease subunit [Chelatococcus daeguensis]|uniref:TRAP transporter small permease protein n=1 Tax=Chelatococcus sambhunathii TaxID=363953 RepID=A0ABM9U441_9HYPH|nr:MULTISPECIES: TRAP transporter small permease subunit [Chelatococcus]KZE29155.1 hypothetical protein AVW15_04955 [Chelatococcus daeguensis]MBM3083867.1 TRAP transporter small permease subunit [Chelatococcus daeguensis]CUA86912.1 TRAP-type C4-dicarboxylate transport system, small permease component [Chelatococcus sambhunathii]